MLRRPEVPVVIDTNVLVVSLYSKTNLANFLFSGILILIHNHYICEEAREIITRLAPRYKKISGVASHETLSIFEEIINMGIPVQEMPESWPPVSPDRDDDPFLWTASQGKAEFIISHDKRHMLKLGTFKGIPIGNAKTFFEWVKIKHPMP
jgi:predicted nucleic acid-binding protein